VSRAGVVVGSDIGGTFTDITVLGEGRLSVAKVPTTPPSFDTGATQGMAAAIAAADVASELVESVLHGTTVATNAILEGRGARTGLLTTEGFRDVLELRRARSPELYNLFYRPPAPLAPRQLRLGVPERMAADGRVLRPLDRAGAKQAIRALGDAGVEAVAISLLHSYRNPAHEQELVRLVRAVLPDAYVSISSEVLPEIGEYERTSTTVINAYLGPVVGAYLSRMESSLAASGITAPILVMQSNGALMGVEVAAQHPARMVESGPAAGVIGALSLATGQGIGDAITFDMGGTTTKAGLIEGGQPLLTAEFEVGGGISSTTGHASGRGHALRLPVLDIAEVGAGGGSIVRVDHAGRIYVGPESAGADPGPAAYGRGGAEPTLTDALIILGYINARVLAGGVVELRPELARRAIAERVGGSLGIGPEQAADGAFRVALAETARAVKHVTTFRGRSPADFRLLAYGGNGPVIAAALAAELGIRRVVVPPSAGVFSSFGLLQADEAHHFVRSVAGSPVAEGLAAAMASLEAEARRFVADQGARDDWRLQAFAELRYREQRAALRVPADREAGEPAWVSGMIERFGSEHARTYGYRATEQDVEFVNLRIIASRPRTIPDRLRRRGDRSAGPTGRRPVWFTGARDWIEVPLLAREQVRGSARGPFIVDEYDSTIVVPPGWAARLDDHANLLLDREDG
jgi:N-methylhydantoinase A